MSDDVRWIRTYVVQEESGQLGTVCIYEGTSAAKVREQAERTGMPADEIALVADTVIVPRPGPGHHLKGPGPFRGPPAPPPAPA